MDPHYLNICQVLINDCQKAIIQFLKQKYKLKKNKLYRTARCQKMKINTVMGGIKQKKKQFSN